MNECTTTRFCILSIVAMTPTDMSESWNCLCGDIWSKFEAFLALSGGLRSNSADGLGSVFRTECVFESAVGRGPLAAVPPFIA